MEVTHGRLDMGFGEAGRVLTEFSRGSTQELNALINQPDPATRTSKIVGAGSVGSVDTNNRFVLACYNADGSLDKSFGGNGTGKVTTNFSIFRPEPPILISLGDAAFALATDRSGRLVVAGSSFFDDGQSQRFALARYNRDGTPDTSFGNRGRVLTNVNSAADGATAVVIQTVWEVVRRGFRFPPAFPLFSKIVAGGTSGDPGTPPTSSVASRITLIRYENDGRLDKSFGDNGIARARHFTLMERSGKRTSRFDRLTALAVQRDGRLVVAGSAQFEGGIRIAVLARFNTNGEPDRSFGTNGRTFVRLPSPGEEVTASALGIQADGKIVVAGGTVGGSGLDQRFVLARRNPDGSPDTSFGSEGFAITNVTIRDRDRSGAEGARALVIRAGGKIVVTGSAEAQDLPTFPFQFVLLQHNPDGGLDPGFGSGGTMPRDPGPFERPPNAQANALIAHRTGAW